MSAVYQIVKNIVFYLILVNIIMNLLGNSSYKKYVRVFTGMLFILLVITPFAKKFSVESLFDYYYEKSRYSIETEDVTGKLLEEEKKQQQAINEEYKKQLEEQLKTILKENHLYAVSIDIQLNEEQTDEKFGRIESVSVLASETVPDEEGGNSIKKIEIKPVDKVKLSEEEKKIKQYETRKKGAKNREELEREQDIKKQIADFYGILTRQITLTIQE